MAHASVADGRIVVATTWSEKELIKQVPGATYSGARREWSAPLSWAACVQLRGVFGAGLTISDELNQFGYRERRTRIDPALALRTQIHVSHNAERDWMRELYDFQRVGV